MQVRDRAKVRDRDRGRVDSFMVGSSYNALACMQPENAAVISLILGASPQH
jgi:hypothetical protein